MEGKNCILLWNEKLSVSFGLGFFSIPNVLDIKNMENGSYTASKTYFKLHMTSILFLLNKYKQEVKFCGSKWHFLNYKQAKFF